MTHSYARGSFNTPFSKKAPVIADNLDREIESNRRGTIRGARNSWKGRRKVTVTLPKLSFMEKPYADK